MKNGLSCFHLSISFFLPIAPGLEDVFLLLPPPCVLPEKNFFF